MNRRDEFLDNGLHHFRPEKYPQKDRQDTAYYKSISSRRQGLLNKRIKQKGKQNVGKKNVKCQDRKECARF